MKTRAFLACLIVLTGCEYHPREYGTTALYVHGPLPVAIASAPDAGAPLPDDAGADGAPLPCAEPPAVISDHWSEPLAVWLGDGAPPPCASGEPLYDAIEFIDSPAECTACACDDPAVCTLATQGLDSPVFRLRSDVSPGLPEVWIDAPDPIASALDEGCHALPSAWLGAASPSFTAGLNWWFYSTFYGPTSAPAPSVPVTTKARNVRACAASDACAPACRFSPYPESECPAGYPDRIDTALGVNDERTCTPCLCDGSGAEGTALYGFAACSSKVTGYSDAACGAALWSATTNQQSIVKVDAAGPVASIRIEKVSAWPVIPPAGGEPQGARVAIDPGVICCQAGAL